MVCSFILKLKVYSGAKRNEIVFCCETFIFTGCFFQAEYPVATSFYCCNHAKSKARKNRDNLNGKGKNTLIDSHICITHAFKYKIL